MTPGRPSRPPHRWFDRLGIALARWRCPGVDATDDAWLALRGGRHDVDRSDADSESPHPRRRWAVSPKAAKQALRETRGLSPTSFGFKHDCPRVTTSFIGGHPMAAPSKDGLDGANR